ncbi:MAG: sugar phosphate isomerase/epimerase family protein [Terracidiphilus sp.]
MNTILLGGTTEQKILAAHVAGFDQLEIWNQDVNAFDGNPETFGNWMREQSISVTDYQIIRDFDGAPDDVRESKRVQALNELDTAVKIGATVVLTTASSDQRCVASRIDEDMRWLAREAAARHLKIAYENLSWSAVNYTLPAVWGVVERLNEPNLGVVIDNFHIFARGRDARDLEDIPMDRIYVVQLSDLNPGQLCDPAQEGYLEQLIDTARHRRLLPGDGQYPIETILQPLRAANYSGAIGVEVFNDEMKARDPKVVAREAIAALKKVWLR